MWERLFILLQVLTGAVLLAAGLTVVALSYAVGKILRKMKADHYVLITHDGPEIHSPMPAFQGFTIEGQLVRSHDFAGREYALLLVSPQCGPCRTLLGAVDAVRQSHVEALEFVVVIECAEEQAQAYRRRYQLHGPVIADPNGGVSLQLGVRRAPYGFLVDGQGIVRMKGVLNHRDHLEALIWRRGKAVSSLIWDLQTGLEADAEESPGAWSRERARDAAGLSAGAE